MASVDFEISKEGTVLKSGTVPVTVTQEVRETYLHPHNPLLGLFGQKVFVGVTVIKFDVPITVLKDESLRINGPEIDYRSDYDSGSPARS